MWNNAAGLRIAGMFGTDLLGRRLIGALALGLCLIGASQAYAAERIALVIGNSAYAQLPRLINPVNDASDVSQSLQRLGFQATTPKGAGFEKLRVARLRGQVILDACRKQCVHAT
jgi:hypothetical protein